MLIALTALGTVLARAGVIVFAVFRGGGRAKLPSRDQLVNVADLGVVLYGRDREIDS